MDAVVLFTKAINRFVKDHCKQNSIVCPKIHQKFDGDYFFHNYLTDMDMNGKVANFSFSIYSLSANVDRLFSTRGPFSDKLGL